MAPMTLIAHVARTLIARQNCSEGKNPEWYARHTETLLQLAHEMPSGSGVDRGTVIDLDRSTADKVVLIVGFHHMDEHGFYAGWTDYTITVRPTFVGISLKISGRDRNGIKDYLYEMYEYNLRGMYSEEYDSDKGSTFKYIPREVAS